MSSRPVTGVREVLTSIAKASNVRQGMACFGSGGTRRAELAGHDTLDDLQKSIADEWLDKLLSQSTAALAEDEVKGFAQRLVNKAKALAETRLDADFPGFNEKLAKSQSLKTSIVKLQRAAWRIERNRPGGGSYCDKFNKTIAIDPSLSLEAALGTLAHETGHALFSPPPKPTVAEVADGIDYVKRCTEVDFLDEGEAQIVACRAVRDLELEGESAAVPADRGEFMAIFDQFQAGAITEDEARREMALKFGNLVTSTTGEKYLTYYGRSHIRAWNAAHGDASMHLTDAILSTIVLFS
jgi:hypothetical protein